MGVVGQLFFEGVIPPSLMTHPNTLSPVLLLVPGRANPVIGRPEFVMGRTAGDMPPCVHEWVGIEFF